MVDLGTLTWYALNLQIFTFNASKRNLPVRDYFSRCELRLPTTLVYEWGYPKHKNWWSCYEISLECCETDLTSPIIISKICRIHFLSWRSEHPHSLVGYPDQVWCPSNICPKLGKIERVQNCLDRWKQNCSIMSFFMTLCYYFTHNWTYPLKGK